MNEDAIAKPIASIISLAAPVVGWVVLGPAAMVVFAVAFVGGFVLWQTTTYRHPIEPDRLIIPYLLTIVLFIVHVYEEYRTNFEELMSNITGVTVSEQGFLTVAAFIGPALWIAGGVLLLRRRPLGYYLLSVLIIAMTIAELAHFVFPFLEDGSFHYASGMYTALLPLIPTAYLAAIVIENTRQETA